MKNNNFLSATLLVSALALSPLVAKSLSVSSQAKVNTTFSNIANILHRRGLEADAALDISNNFINEQNLMLFAMISNLEKGCSIVSKEEVLDYLSSSALRKQSVFLDDYSFLVGMVHEIKKRALRYETLQELEKIATENAILS